MSDNPLDRILAKLDVLEACQKQLETGQTQLRIDLMGRMDRLGDDIGRIRDDIGVNMGRPERAIEAADHNRKELRSLGSEVAAMWRKVNRLQSDVRDLRGAPWLVSADQPPIDGQSGATRHLVRECKPFGRKPPEEAASIGCVFFICAAAMFANRMISADNREPPSNSRRQLKVRFRA